MSRLDIRNEFFKATLENLSAEEKALRDGLPNQEYIDIIQYVPNSGSGFGAYWHTINDTMDNIDKNTLNAVGTTLMHVVYNE